MKIYLCQATGEKVVDPRQIMSRIRNRLTRSSESSNGAGGTVKAQLTSNQRRSAEPYMPAKTQTTRNTLVDRQGRHDGCEGLLTRGIFTADRGSCARQEDLPTAGYARDVSKGFVL